VAIKLSGLGFIRRDWDQPLVLPLLAQVVDLFGTQRAMFASDTPTDKLFAPCPAIWTSIAVSRRGSASKSSATCGGAMPTASTGWG
jgi:predicted TIM-barrel fold metal-dependent hydrolase